MAGPSRAEIKKEVNVILETADLTTLCERNIRELLTGKFGDVVQTDAYKKMIAVTSRPCPVLTHQEPAL